MKQLKILFSVLLVLLIGGIFVFRLVPFLHLKSHPVMIVVRPFEDLPKSQSEYVFHEIKKLFPATQISSPLNLPTAAFYPSRNRYRADSLIAWLSRSATADIVFLGITSKDISTTKGDIADWGVMGLGYEPGNACVVSTFRLGKGNLEDQLFKVCIHELGHNMGLSHCTVSYCYMRNAEGHNTKTKKTVFALPVNKKWRLRDGFSENRGLSLIIWQHYKIP